MDTETILMNHRPPEEPDKQTMSIEALVVDPSSDGAAAAAHKYFTTDHIA